MYQSEPHPDPYGAYARMRAEHGPVVPVELAPGVHGWLVTDYATLISWSRDTTVFTHDARLWRDFARGRVGPGAPLPPMADPRAGALFVDGAEHRRPPGRAPAAGGGGAPGYARALPVLLG